MIRTVRDPEPAPAADGHVHSEWSWDAQHGSMERSCARAVRLGVPAIAFTEHLDHTVWAPDLTEVDPGHPIAVLTAADGRLTPPALDVTGYFESIESCRDQFPDLRILSGLEVGEPHWHAQAAERVLAQGTFDRVLGSLHCLPDADLFREPPGLYARRDPYEVVRDYLHEVVRLVSGSDAFSVLAHLDYPLRSWPAALGPPDVSAFEAEFREALRALADSGRALEINTARPLEPSVLRWWHEEGGEAVTFGSDAHAPDRLARDFRAAVDLARAHGFRPGDRPYDFWRRSA